MYKGSAILLSVFVLLVVASQFAASSDTNITYLIGELNTKLTYLQGRLDLFDYLTEGNRTELVHRVEVKELIYAENLTLQIKETNVKLNALDRKLDALDAKVTNIADTIRNCDESGAAREGAFLGSQADRK